MQFFAIFLKRFSGYFSSRNLLKLQETVVSNTESNPDENNEAVNDDKIQFIKEIMKKPKIDTIAMIR